MAQKALEIKSPDFMAPLSRISRAEKYPICDVEGFESSRLQASAR
jgi:hypothetical protein